MTGARQTARHAIARRMAWCRSVSLKGPALQALCPHRSPGSSVSATLMVTCAPWCNRSSVGSVKARHGKTRRWLSLLTKPHSSQHEDYWLAGTAFRPPCNPGVAALFAQAEADQVTVEVPAAQGGTQSSVRISQSASNRLEIHRSLKWEPGRIAFGGKVFRLTLVVSFGRQEGHSGARD